MEIILTDIGSSSLGYKLIHAMSIVSHTARQLKKKVSIFFLINMRLKANKSAQIQVRIEAEMKLFSPLDQGQAFRPKPIRVLSSQNLEDPVAMSFYKIHMKKKMRNGFSKIDSKHSKSNVYFC
jgi:hypothetical protein